MGFSIIRKKSEKIYMHLEKLTNHFRVEIVMLTNILLNNIFFHQFFTFYNYYYVKSMFFNVLMSIIRLIFFRFLSNREVFEIIFESHVRPDCTACTSLS